MIVINVNQTENKDPIKRWITRWSLHQDNTTQVANTNRTVNNLDFVWLFWLLLIALLYIESIPMYCVQNLFTSKRFKINTNGLAQKDTNNGPRNERGTTPGYSWWSYCNWIYWNLMTEWFKELKIFTCDRFVPWYNMSCIAWILKLSSTFVNGVYNKWTIAIKKTRTPIWLW